MRYVFTKVEPSLSGHPRGNDKWLMEVGHKLGENNGELFLRRQNGGLGCLIEGGRLMEVQQYYHFYHHHHHHHYDHHHRYYFHNLFKNR